MIPFYAASVISWIYLRHVLNLRILYSTLTEFRAVGPYELDWEAQQYKCWFSNLVTSSLLSILQCLNLIWLYYLLRSAIKFLLTGEKKDDRSEPEESELEMETSPLEANRAINHVKSNGFLDGNIKGPSEILHVNMNGAR